MATKSMFDTKDRLSQQTDYTSVLIEANRDELVLIDYLTRTGIKGIAAGKDWTRETEAKSAQKVGIKRIAEGNDWDKATSVETNHIIKSMLEIAQSEGWRVTEESEILDHGRLPTIRASDAIEDDAFKLMLGIERVIGSAQECVDHTSTATVTKTRGLGCWLQPGAHSVLDFEEQHRPAAELSTEGTTEIAQAQLEAIMEQAYAKARHRLNLTAFVGIGLKRTISGFLNAVQTVSGYESTLRRSIDADARGIVNIVDFMEFPTGRVQTVLIPVPFADTATLDETAQSKDGGLFLELERFGLEWVQRVTHRDMSDKLNLGGGRRGYHRAMYRVNCQDASGSFRVVRTAGG